MQGWGFKRVAAQESVPKASASAHGARKGTNTSLALHIAALYRWSLLGDGNDGGDLGPLCFASPLVLLLLHLFSLVLSRPASPRPISPCPALPRPAPPCPALLHHPTPPCLATHTPGRASFYPRERSGSMAAGGRVINTSESSSSEVCGH
ncbi:hypothetical protein E2C01_073901 [Portunus trituberculatus]|uniref:Uncharacterized protein n=1 Tax=Portunus trituberculatus TaxID=210409 RepID=A0A5B7IBU0_PORTR|nr:hypothetical protein [Portunus trituberculatus]